MLDIPVVLFVYNRLDHTKATVEALSKNNNSENINLYIFSDGYKEKSYEDVIRVRTYIDSIATKYHFKSVKIEKSEQNRGLAKSVIQGVSKVIDRHGSVIVLEDDLVTSVDFYDFMSMCLETYKSNEKIWSISGYSFSIPEGKDDLFLSRRGSSWGWATWKDRWKMVEWEATNYNLNKSIIKKLNAAGADLKFLLDLQINKKIDSWATIWCYTEVVNNMFTVYPKDSRVVNIGLDDTGTHSRKGKSTDKFKTQLAKSEIVPHKNIKFNEKVNKIFLKHYKVSMKSEIKYYLKKK